MTAASSLRFEPAELPSLPSPPQACWRALRAGAERARIGLWWQGTPPLAGQRLGTIGALAVSDQAAEADPAVVADATALLRFGCERLEDQGCTRVLAPMDGSTWGAYRCRLQEPLGFAGEPAWGPGWASILAAAGFHRQTRYLSSLCSDLGFRRVGPRAQRRLAGVELQDGMALAAAAAAGDRAAAALEPRLHRLVEQAFAAQPWFMPLPAAVFAGALRSRLGADPSPLALVAWAEGEPVGLMLGHRAADQLVVRTLAVLPERRFAGLGALLLEEAHAIAQAAGCRSAIHALMREGGASEALSRHYARPVARYALMARSLG